MAQSLSGCVVFSDVPTLTFVFAGQQLPFWTDRTAVTAFLHDHLKPYEDTLSDIRRGLDDALENRPSAGGFVVLAHNESRLVGVLVMLGTGMKGYVSENLLLFIAVERAVRGHGIGSLLVRAAIGRCSGEIKLHVEYDNPAKRLYERLGFSSKYAEMRCGKETRS